MLPAFPWAPSDLPGSWPLCYQPLHLDRERGLETYSLLCVVTQICTLCLHCAAGSRGQWDTSKEVQPPRQTPLIHCLVGFEGGFGEQKAAFLCGTWPEALRPLQRVLFIFSWVIISVVSPGASSQKSFLRRACSVYAVLHGFSVACGEYCILFQFCLPDNVKMVQEKAASYMQHVLSYSHF